jgi:SdpI/YfhL protein family
MSIYDKGLITVTIAAAVFALIAIPLMLRRVPRNVVYGFRTPATLASDEVWYDVNAHFGRGLLIASILSIVAIFVLYSTAISPQRFLTLSIVVLVAPAAIATIATTRYLWSITH